MSSRKKKRNQALQKKISSDTFSSPHTTNKAKFFDHSFRLNWFVAPSSVIVFIFGLSWVLYINTLDAEFHFDDYSYIVEMPNVEFGIDIRDLKGSTQKLLDEFYLPGKRLFYVTLALNYYFSELDRGTYRLVNILIHATNGCLVFSLFLLLFRRWLPAKEKSPQELYQKSLGLILALFFVSHPLAVNSVTYITQRTGALAALFYLLSFVSYLRFKECKNNRKWAWLVFAVTSYWAAFQSKSMAITLPLIVLCFELVESFRDQKLFRRWLVIAGFGSIIFLAAVLGYAYKIKMFSPHSMDVGFNSPGLWSPWIHFLTELRVFVHYWQLLILPWYDWLSVNHGFELSKELTEWRTLGALVFHLSVLTGGIFLVRKGFRMAGFGIFWFYLTLSPPYLVLPQRELMVEYKTYLPSIGWFLIAGELLWKTQKKIPCSVKGIVMAVILAFFCGTTLLRNEIFQTGISLWSDVLKKYPENARAYNNRATSYLRHDRYDEAILDFAEAIHVEPGFLKAHNNRGNAYFQLQKYELALKDYNQTIRLIKTQPETIQSMVQYSLVYYQRGKTWMALKQFPQAINDFNQFLKWHPDDKLSYISRAHAFAEIKNFQSALKDYERAMQLDPDNAVIFSNRGNVYSLTKQYDRAIKDYDQALRLDPQHIPTLLNRGNLYLMMENIKKAIEDYDHVLRLQANHPSAARLKKLALSRLKHPEK
ncbi:MAG: tetratricopeptide repeat protein [SAR324 cluster bacterium]|nr:tetratricopeptide repeat protein [SAR324 cluster bacterium]